MNDDKDAPIDERRFRTTLDRAILASDQPQRKTEDGHRDDESSETRTHQRNAVDAVDSHDGTSPTESASTDPKNPQ